MGFIAAIKTCLGKYTDFKGRALRLEFWYFILFVVVISGVLQAVSSLLYFVFGLAVMMPQFAVSARRLHDIGKSGWWQLLGVGFVSASLILELIMIGAFVDLLFLWVVLGCLGFISFLMLVVWYCRKGEGDNRFGTAPVPHTAN